MAGSKRKVKVGTVESRAILDAFELRKANAFREGWTGVRTWWRGNENVASVGLWCRDDSIFVQWSSGAQRLRLSRSPRHFGGGVTYLCCPACGLRFARLVMTATGFACRACAKVSYRSESHRRGAAPHIHNARRLRIRLGGTGDLTETFPEKRKRFRWVPYWRLMSRALEAEKKAFGHLRAELERLTGRPFDPQES